MDHQDLRTLRILEEIENSHTPSQRDLAKKLNISLGLVNAFIKRLAHKGYFKITTIPRNRVAYMLTPKGMAEKTRLTYEFIHFSFQFYRKARTRLQEIFSDLEMQGGGQVIFYGAGELAEIAYISLQETSMKLIAVVDEQKIGERFLGMDIRNPDSIKGMPFDKIIITVMNSGNKILDSLLQKGIPRHKVAIVN
ncbi:MAG: winged helix-turn-helix transcriptional regulator [Thermodesulfobacteriota bacterium]